MATYVNDLRLKEIATGDESGTWGTSTNTNLELIGEALGYGTQDCFSSDADATTTVADGATDPARSMYFKVTSSATLSATRTLTIAPNTISRVMFIENATTGSQSIAISQGSGANVTIATGKTAVVYLDGAGSGAAVVDAMALVDPGVTDTLAEVLTAGNTTGGTSLVVSSGDDVTFTGASANVVFDSSDSAFEFADNAKAIFGAGSDLQIYHNGSHSFISDQGTGNMLVLADNFEVNSANNTANKITATTGGAVTLFHNNSAKLATTSTGVDVTGALTTSGNLTVNGADVTITANIIHSGDTNTFFGFPSDDTFRIVTSGSEALRVNSSQNVGIGTTSPNVSGYDANAKALTISGTNRGLLELRGATGANSTQLGAIRFLSGSTSEADIICELDSSGNGLLTFDTNGSERLRIDTSGNLLAGTTETDIGFTDSGAGFSVSPLGAVQVARSSTNELLYLNKLDNDGDIVRFSKDGTEVGTVATTSSRLSIGSNDVGLFFDSTNERFTPIDQANQTDRDALIDLGYASSRFKDLYLSGDLVLGASNGFVFGNTNGVNIRAASGKSTIIDTAGSERMRIDSSGKVGIGESSPTGLLHVKGDTNSNGAELYLQVNNNNTTDNLGAIHFGNNVDETLSTILSGTSGANNTSYLTFSTSAAGTLAEAMRINSSGDVGIGSTTVDRGKLHVNHIVQSSAGAFSDPHIALSFSSAPTDNDSFAGISYATSDSDNYGWTVGAERTSGGVGDFIFTQHNNSATGSEKVRIDSSGKVGIGGTPSSTLDVGCGAIADPTLRIDSAAGGDPVLLFDTGAASRSSFVDFRDQGTLAGSIIYSHADDHLGFSVASNNRSEAARIDSSGKLLVGDSASHTSDLLQIETPASGGGHGIQIRRNDANGDQTIGTISFGNNTDTDLARISAKTDGDGNNGDSGALLFSTQPTSGSLTERMRIRSDGHALFTLATNATGTFQDNVGEVGSGNFCLQVTNDSLGSLKPLGFRAEDIRFATGSSERMRIDSGGRVGIFNSSPVNYTGAGARSLVVGSNSSASDPHGITIVGGSSSTSNLAFTDNAGDGSANDYRGLFQYAHSDDSLRIFVASAERMRIDPSGILILGSPGGNSTGVIQGSTGAGSTNQPGTDLQLKGGPGGGTGGSKVKFFTAPGGSSGTAESASREVAQFNEAGNLLVGDTSSSFPTNVRALKVFESNIAISHNTSNTDGDSYVRFGYSTNTIGSITQNGTTAVLYNTSSDQRLKENIVDAPSASDDIDAIQVRSFDWKADGSHQKYGMVAQELVTVAPEAVSQPEDPEEMMGVDYSKLVPMLIKEVQQLRARVAQLEGDN